MINGLYYCRACHYIFPAAVLPDRCPDCGKDVYDTVCSFSNRDCGHIFLEVRDNGTILGIQPDRIDQIKKNFVTCINNENKMYPPLYPTPIDYALPAERSSKG